MPDEFDEAYDTYWFEKKAPFAPTQWYGNILAQARLNIDARFWLTVSALASAIAGALVTIVIVAVHSPISPFMGIVTALIVADIMLGYPYLKASNRIDSIEEMLPDALKQMSDTLRAGGTYEFALREIATSEYGALSEEIESVLRTLEEGENLETSLMGFAHGIDSKLIKRSVAVMLDAIKAGAGLADLLDEIADDMRAMRRISQERKAETLMQVIFMVVAGSIIAPLIFGLVSTIISVFIQTSAGLGLSIAEREEALLLRGNIMTLIQAYMLVEVVASGAMISIMREGKFGKSIIYLPVLLLVAYACYYLSAFASGAMIGGMT